MQVAVAQVPLFVQQQVAEETFQIDGCIVYPFRHIVVVCTHQRIAEIPRVFCKQVISPQRNGNNPALFVNKAGLSHNKERLLDDKAEVWCRVLFVPIVRRLNFSQGKLAKTRLFLYLCITKLNDKSYG